MCNNARSTTTENSGLAPWLPGVFTVFFTTAGSFFTMMTVISAEAQRTGIVITCLLMAVLFWGLAVTFVIADGYRRREANEYIRSPEAQQAAADGQH